MDIREFTQTYREAFGEAAPLPVAFGYSNIAAEEVRNVPRCIIGAISQVRNGQPLTLAAGNVKCGGGGLYTGFHEMPERVPEFVSHGERYKQSPDMVCQYIAGMDIRPAEKPYLNFRRMDTIQTLDEVEGILFWATPDVLSGLASWAFFDNNSPDAVCTPFASGCAAIVSFTVKENREGGRRCFLGMLDPSARPLVPKYELTFSIPKGRFVEMLGTIRHSSLFQHAFSVVRKRINGELGKAEQ